MDQIIDVFIEIPKGTSGKYEYDLKTGRLYLDHFLPEPFKYPENYGFIANTEGKDGDPLDALVLTTQPLEQGTWIKVRIIGMMEMEDEHGEDSKILCVPSDQEVDQQTGYWSELSDIPTERTDTIRSFFEHYKDWEKDGWTKVKSFVGKEQALKEVELGFLKTPQG